MPQFSNALARWRDLPILMRGSAVSIVGLGLSQAATIAVEATIAKQLGPAELGTLAIGATISSLFSITIVAGCVVAVARSVALADEKGESSHVRAYLLLGLAVALTTSILIASGLVAARGVLNMWLGSSKHGDVVIALFGLALPFQAVAGVALAANRALGRVAADVIYLFVDGAVRLLAVPSLILLSIDVQSVAVLYVAAAVIACPFAVAPVLSSLRPVEHANATRASIDIRAFSSFAGWQIVGAGVWAAARRADLLTVSILVGPAAAGQYRLALLFASIGSVIQSSLQPMFIPVSARGFSRGGSAALVGQYRRVTRVTVLVSAPVFALSIAGAARWMGAFGATFAQGSDLLTVLCIAFALDGAAGPATGLLTAAGLARRSALNLTVAFAAELALLAFLVPTFAGVGAAAALAGTFLTVELLQMSVIAAQLRQPVTDAKLANAVGLMFVLLLIATLLERSQSALVAIGVTLLLLTAFGALAGRFALTGDDVATFTGSRRSLP